MIEPFVVHEFIKANEALESRNHLGDAAKRILVDYGPYERRIIFLLMWMCSVDYMFDYHFVLFWNCCAHLNVAFSVGVGAHTVNDWFHMCPKTVDKALEFESKFRGSSCLPVQADETKTDRVGKYRKGKRLIVYIDEHDEGEIFVQTEDGADG